MYLLVWQKDSHRNLICRAISMLVIIPFLGLMLVIPQPALAREYGSTEDTEIPMMIAAAAGITLIITLIWFAKQKNKENSQEKDAGSDEARHQEGRSDKMVKVGMGFSKQLALEKSMEEENHNLLPVRKAKWDVLAGYGDDQVFVGVSCRW